MNYSLNTVTLTGIDDHTDPADLHRIARQARGLFTVEFGVLHSDRQAGKGRYPSKEKIFLFLFGCANHGTPEFKFSAHLCGAVCRDFFKKPKGDEWSSMLSGFDRIQLNRNFVRSPMVPGESWDYVVDNALRVFSPDNTSRVILQLNPNNRRELGKVLSNPASRISRWANLLYDASGGHGHMLPISPNLKAGFDQIVKGSYVEQTPPAYAGGINPRNVARVVRELDMLYRFQKNNQFSIDMESGLRDGDDRFSVDLACQVIRTCADTMEELYTHPV